MMKPFRTFRQLGNRGDTIVEVLIVLAVLGLAMSISYAAANKGLQQSRNAQEHSQALGLINSQVELMRSAFATGAGPSIEAMNTSPPKPFCLSAIATGVKVNPIMTSAPNDFRETLGTDHLNSSEYGAACSQDTLYYVSVEGRGNSVYDFRVRWEGLGSLGRQQEELTYKIGNIIPVAANRFTDAEIPPPPPFSGALNVIVQAIPLTTVSGGSVDPTPSCSDAGSNLDGTAVTLSGTGGPVTKTTNSSSLAAFTGLQQGDTYNISISRDDYEVCPSGGNTGVASAATPTPAVTKKIRPVCKITSYNNYYTRSPDASFSAFFIFANFPTNVYFQSYTETNLIGTQTTHTKTDPNWWYAEKGKTILGISWYYYVYDAVYHSDPVYTCPS